MLTAIKAAPGLVKSSAKIYLDHKLIYLMLTDELVRVSSISSNHDRLVLDYDPLIGTLLGIEVLDFNIVSNESIQLPAPDYSGILMLKPPYVTFDDPVSANLYLDTGLLEVSFEADRVAAYIKVGDHLTAGLNSKGELSRIYVYGFHKYNSEGLMEPFRVV
jgi:hypothetical protein